jgi:hypothetical protein
MMMMGWMDGAIDIPYCRGGMEGGERGERAGGGWVGGWLEGGGGGMRRRVEGRALCLLFTILPLLPPLSLLTP